MGRPLRVLIVEDSEEDAFLLERELRHGGYEPMSERVASEPAMREALNRQSWDIVISDYVLPGFGGLEALALFHERNLEAPFIVVSGHIGEDIAVAAMKAGADDYLMKDRLARLTPAVSRALERAEIRHARKVAEEQLAAKARELQATVEALRLRESELRESNDKLSQARAELEKRVQERTADLTAANAELKNQMTERKRLENELLEVAENERRRIGFDLHDDIGQKLMGVSLLLKALETNLAHKQLPEADQTREVQGLLGQVINHTHDLARCFSSLDCQGDDLGGLLQKLIANVRRTFPLNCRLRVSEPLPALIPEVTLQLYKIAQESISNAIKHGKAQRVSIALAPRQGEVVLQIKNDGTPFPGGGTPTNRLGLHIMNYRARTIGGTLDIHPAGESGTVLTCRVPFGNGPTAMAAPTHPPTGRKSSAALARV